MKEKKQAAPKIAGAVALPEKAKKILFSTITKLRKAIGGVDMTGVLFVRGELMEFKIYFEKEIAS